MNYFVMLVFVYNLYMTFALKNKQVLNLAFQETLRNSSFNIFHMKEKLIYSDAVRLEKSHDRARNY